MEDSAPQIPKAKSETKLVVALVIVSVVVAICALWPSRKPLTPEQLAQSDLIITDIKAAPIEYQLAYLDSGRLPTGTDVNAARIRYLLKTLSEKTETPLRASATKPARLRRY